MHPILRNVIAVLLGTIACLVLNGLLLGLLMTLLPPPDGFDPNAPVTYGLLQPRHYLSPFLAHAIPSFIGGAIAALIAIRRKLTFALAVGGLHLLGGIAAAFMIPAPAWFIALDLIVAYLPMAALGGWLAARKA